MKRILATCSILVLCSARILYAQISVTVSIRNPVPAHLAIWERDRTIVQAVFVNTTQNTYQNVRVHFEIRDAGDGRVLAHSNDNDPAIPRFTIGTTPVVRFTPDLYQGRAVTLDERIRGIVQTTNMIPEGTYLLCLRVLDESGADLLTGGEVCNTFTVIIPDPPTLLRPAMGDTVRLREPLMFTWTPVFLGTGQPVQYRLVIAPIMPGQRARDAIERNNPLFNQLLSTTSFFYGPGTPQFALYPMATGFAWQVQALDMSGMPATRNQGMSEIAAFWMPPTGPPIALLTNLPDTLAAGSFRIVVESWDSVSQSLNPSLPSGIGRVRFTCPPELAPPVWQNLEMAPKSFTVVNTIQDSSSQLIRPDAQLFKHDAKIGDNLTLNLPQRNTIMESIVDKTVLIDFMKKKSPESIRVRFRDVQWAGPVSPMVTLTGGIAWYPTSPAVPDVPAEVNLSSGFTLAIDSLVIMPSQAIVTGSIYLPPCMVSDVSCTRASLNLPPSTITSNCDLYRELPDSNFGAFFVGETGLKISGHGYTVDFSSSLSDPAVTPALPGSWKGVVLKSGSTPNAPTDTITSNRGYVKAKYEFTNGLVTKTGLASRFDLSQPFLFRTLEPYDYLVKLFTPDGYLDVDSCRITGGEFKSGRILLPTLAIRDLNGDPITANYATLQVQPDMDLFGQVNVRGGLAWGEFAKTSGHPRFFELSSDSSFSPPITNGYFYLAARQMQPYYPVSGSTYTTPMFSPPSIQLEALGMQGVTISQTGKRMFTIWTTDVPWPGHLLTNPPRLSFAAKNVQSFWMNIIGTGVHTEIVIMKDPVLPDTTELGPTWSDNPKYRGETPLYASFRNRGPKQRPNMKLQFVESATWDSDFNGYLRLGGPMKDTVDFKRLMFTSTADAGGAELDLSKPAKMDYWGVKLVPKDTTKSAGVVCVKLGVIYLTAAGIWEPRHFDKPFYLTWGEIKASGSVGRLEFDYNNAGQRFDRFAYTPTLIALSKYTLPDSGKYPWSGYLETNGTLAANFFGSKTINLRDWKDNSVPAAPYNRRRILLAAGSDLHWTRGWSDGVGTLDFTMRYDSLAQDGFVGIGDVGILKLIPFESALAATINVKAERSCFTVAQEAASNINIGPAATSSNVAKIWGCGCILGETLERVAVGGELSTSGGAGASILARGGGSVTFIASVEPTRATAMIAGDFFVVILTNNAEVVGFANFTVDLGAGSVSGYLKGLMKLDNLVGGISGVGEFDWHLGADYQSIQGRVAVAMFTGSLVGGGAGIEAGVFLGINAPKDKAWVMDGISGRFGLNKAGLPARLTGFYAYLSFSASVNLFIVSGGYQTYVGFGAFVGTGAPVTDFAFGMIGNVGLFVWGKILGGLVSAEAWGNLQLIAGIPPGFEGSFGVGACVLWIFCGSVTVHAGFNAAQGFYVY